MKTIAAILLSVLGGLFTSSIYTKQLTTLEGTQIGLAQYQGKKMLLVNIASGSEYAATQLPQLEQLYQQYKDSLVVLAFPSNDFGNEARSNADIKLLLQDTYHVSFPVSVLTGIKDSSSTTHAIYHWLQNQNENGSMNATIKKDFQKFLIDKDGTLLGVFSAKTSPADSTIINAITQ